MLEGEFRHGAVAIQLKVFEVARFLSGMERKNRSENTPNQIEEHPKHRCSECRRELSMGDDALSLEQVVIGPRGPIPIGEMRLLHIRRCLEDYVCRSDDREAPKRIP